MAGILTLESSLNFIGRSYKRCAQCRNDEAWVVKNWNRLSQPRGDANGRTAGIASTLPTQPLKNAP